MRGYLRRDTNATFRDSATRDVIYLEEDSDCNRSQAAVELRYRTVSLLDVLRASYFDVCELPQSRENRKRKIENGTYTLFLAVNFSFPHYATSRYTNIIQNESNAYDPRGLLYPRKKRKVKQRSFCEGKLLAREVVALEAT